MTKYEWVATLSEVVGHMSGREQDIARKSFEAGQKSIQATKLPNPPIYCNAGEVVIAELRLV